jgi:CBS domain-containing protein
MQTPLQSMEQLMPFATAAELLAKKAQPVASVAQTSTVAAAMQRMEEMRAGLAVVLDGEKLVGVISERDCARAVVLRSLPADQTIVRDVMTTPVLTASPQNKIPECVKLMHDKGIGHLPVVANGRVQGVLSLQDIMGALIERYERIVRRLQEERLTILYPDTGSY